MKRAKRCDAIPSGATTLGHAQLGQVRGGASMVEYALVSNPPTLASNPPTLASKPEVAANSGPLGVW